VLKSCNWESRPPDAVSSTLRSTATEDGLRRTGKRKSQHGRRGGQRQFFAPDALHFAHPGVSESSSVSRKSS
jgi:hypothetical protein